MQACNCGRRNRGRHSSAQASALRHTPCMGVAQGRLQGSQQSTVNRKKDPPGYPGTNAPGYPPKSSILALLLVWSSTSMYGVWLTADGAIGPCMCVDLLILDCTVSFLHVHTASDLALCISISISISISINLLTLLPYTYSKEAVFNGSVST